MEGEIWEVTLNRNYWSTGIFTQNQGFTENAKKKKKYDEKFNEWQVLGDIKAPLMAGVMGLAHKIGAN